MVHTQEVCVLCVCTKFEADSSISSTVIKGYQNFEIGTHDPRHAHLGVSLTFDLLTLKIVSESRVTWATTLPILVFLGSLFST